PHHLLHRLHRAGPHRVRGVLGGSPAPGCRGRAPRGAWAGRSERRGRVTALKTVAPQGTERLQPAPGSGVAAERCVTGSVFAPDSRGVAERPPAISAPESPEQCPGGTTSRGPRSGSGA